MKIITGGDGQYVPVPVHKGMMRPTGEDRISTTVERNKRFLAIETRILRTCVASTLDR